MSRRMRPSMVDSFKATQKSIMAERKGTVTFDKIRQKQKVIAEKFEKHSGVDQALILKIMQYAQLLANPVTGIIEENVFKAQMCYRFSLTSALHLQLMYEAVLRYAATPGLIYMEDYLQLMCMLYSTKLDPKIDFVFRAYDIDCDGAISITEMQMLLRSCVVSVNSLDDTQSGVEDIDSFSDEPLKEVIDMVLDLMDINRDGFISVDEFRNYVKKNSLYIELLGQVLPQDTHLNTFMHSLRRMSDSHLKEFFRHERSRSLNEPASLLKRMNKKSHYPVALDLVEIV